MRWSADDASLFIPLCCKQIISETMKLPKIATLSFLLAAAYALDVVSSFTIPTLKTTTSFGRNQDHLTHSRYQPNRVIRSNNALVVLQSQTAAAADISSETTTLDNNIIGTVALLVPSSSSDHSSKYGSKSPVKPPTYHKAAEQLARKIFNFQMDVSSLKSLPHPMKIHLLCWLPMHWLHLDWNLHKMCNFCQGHFVNVAQLQMTME